MMMSISISFIEDLCHHFFRFFVACFDVFGFDSVAVSCFAFFESVDGSLQLFNREFWNFSRFLHIGTLIFFDNLLQNSPKDIGNSFS